MADLNNVTLTGRLVRNAELKQTPRGVTVCEFSIANNFVKMTGDVWEKDANFFDLAIFDKKATSLYPFLKQGVLVGVEAEIRQNRWEKDGQNRSSNDIHVRNINLLSSSKSVQANDQDNTNTHEESNDFDFQEEDTQSEIY